MTKSLHLITCGIALVAVLASYQAGAQGIDPQSLHGNDSKISQQGLKRAQKAELNKKMLEKKRAEDRAREQAREKSKGKCKGCPAEPPFDQSALYRK